MFPYHSNYFTSGNLVVPIDTTNGETEDGPVEGPSAKTEIDGEEKRMNALVEENDEEQKKRFNYLVSKFFTCKLKSIWSCTSTRVVIYPVS